MIAKEDLKAEAKCLGFWLCGITGTESPSHLDQYAAWINAGHHADMTYMASPRAISFRADPQKLLPGCQSIIVLAAPYPAPNEDISAEMGQIAAYARSTDYHNVLPPRLEALADWIARHAGRDVNWRGFTDTAPILEKELAQRAGLGWIGKNTCLVHPTLGSYFVLAELFTDLALEPDPPFAADRCGSCHRCIDACPTGCIQPNRTIDASRCLSYLTIENKDEIPTKLRSQLGSHIFGCDVCQTVCPWNRKPAIPSEQTLFPPLEDIQTTKLTSELQLDDPAFRDRFRHTPVARAKRRGYLRNVAVSLGNLAQDNSIPALIACLLQDPEPLVRAHAAWALGCFSAPQAQTALQNALGSETLPAVLNEIQQALHNSDSNPQKSGLP